MVSESRLIRSGTIYSCYSSRIVQGKLSLRSGEKLGNVISWHFEERPEKKIGKRQKYSKASKRTMFFLIEESENCWQLISLKFMSASVGGVCGKKLISVATMKLLC